MQLETASISVLLQGFGIANGTMRAIAVKQRLKEVFLASLETARNCRRIAAEIFGGGARLAKFGQVPTFFKVPEFF